MSRINTVLSGSFLFGGLVIGVLVIGVLPVSVFAGDSLINPANYRGLNSDRRAFREGDVLTVIVIESTSAQSAAGTGAKSDFAIDATASDTVGSSHVGLGIGGKTDDTGQTVRSGQVRTQMSVRVLEALPQQMLKIRGEQSITVNGEKQRVSIAGIIRADDISNDNIVLSNRIADANIEIIGDGDVSDAQKQNIIFRVFKWLGLL